MSTNYTAFLPEVSPYATDCPQLVAVNAIRNACIEFCETTHFWQYLVPAFDATANVGDYTVTVPADTRLVVTREGWYLGTKLIAKTQDELQQIYRNLPWTGQSGTPQFVTSIDPTQVRLVPYPNTTVTGAVVLMVAVAPTRASTTMSNDEIYNRYAELIALGTRARIHAIAGNSFYDMDTAEACKKKFNVGMAEVAAKVNRGLTRAGVKIRFRKP